MERKWGSQGSGFQILITLPFMPTIKRKLDIFEEFIFYIQKEKRLKQELQSSSTQVELFRTRGIIESLLTELKEPTT